MDNIITLNTIKFECDDIAENLAVNIAVCANSKNIELLSNFRESNYALIFTHAEAKFLANSILLMIKTENEQ